MKQRSVGLCIVFSIITCGIYALYWFYCMTEEANTATGQGTTSGGMALLFNIITCGIYGIYWSYKMGEKLDAARVAGGAPYGNLAILYLILSIFGLQIVTYALVQSELNKFTYIGGDGV